VTGHTAGGRDGYAVFASALLILLGLLVLFVFEDGSLNLFGHLRIMSLMLFRNCRFEHNRFGFVHFLQRPHI
jgi:hypothetical protein